MAASPKTSIKLGCGCGPIPPSMRIVKSVTATRSMRSRTWRMARLDPMSGAAPSRRMRANCGGRPSARSISSTSAATCVAASSSSHVHPSSVRPGFEHDFDPGALRQHDGRNVEDHDVAGGLLRRRPFTHRHRSRAHHGPEFLLEAFAHRRRTGRDRQGADDRLEERRGPSPTFRTAPVRAPRCRRHVQHLVHRVHLSSRPLCTTPAFQGQCQRRARAIVRGFARGWFRRPLGDGASG